MSHAQSLMLELDDVLSRTSSSRHVAILRRVTDLFVDGVERYSDDLIEVFDDVIGRLMESMDRSVLIELSGRLAPVGNAPLNVIGRLSSDNNINVSRPVLEQSTVLTDETLVDIARNKGQEHLAAIAARSRLGEAVTDILIERGGPETMHKLVANKGACISELGFVRLISMAGRDRSLAAAIAERDDVPSELRPFLEQALA